MNVKQLKESLATLPNNMDVFMAERKTEFDFGLVNSVYTKEIDYKEDVTGVTLATERVLVLDEE